MSWLTCLKNLSKALPVRADHIPDTLQLNLVWSNESSFLGSKITLQMYQHALHSRAATEAISHLL